MKFINPFTDPLPGERTVGVSPRPTPEIDAPWMRGNYRSGRAVSAGALHREQDHRAGRLALLGQALRPGVVRGLEVTRTAADRIEVSAGHGICGSGEDAVLPRKLSVTPDVVSVRACDLTEGAGFKNGKQPELGALIKALAKLRAAAGTGRKERTKAEALAEAKAILEARTEEERRGAAKAEAEAAEADRTEAEAERAEEDIDARVTQARAELKAELAAFQARADARMAEHEAAVATAKAAVAAAAGASTAASEALRSAEAARDAFAATVEASLDEIRRRFREGAVTTPPIRTGPSDTLRAKDAELATTKAKLDEIAAADSRLAALLADRTALAAKAEAAAVSSTVISAKDAQIAATKASLAAKGTPESLLVALVAERDELATKASAATVSGSVLTAKDAEITAVKASLAQRAAADATLTALVSERKALASTVEEATTASRILSERDTEIASARTTLGARAATDSRLTALTAERAELASKVEAATLASGRLSAKDAEIAAAKVTVSEKVAAESRLAALVAERTELTSKAEAATVASRRVADKDLEITAAKATLSEKTKAESALAALLDERRELAAKEAAAALASGQLASKDAEIVSVKAAVADRSGFESRFAGLLAERDALAAEEERTEGREAASAAEARARVEMEAALDAVRAKAKTKLAKLDAAVVDARAAAASATAARDTAADALTAAEAARDAFAAKVERELEDIRAAWRGKTGLAETGEAPAKATEVKTAVATERANSNARKVSVAAIKPQSKAAALSRIIEEISASAAGPLPFLAVLALEPVEHYGVSDADAAAVDPCDRDADAEPFADWRRTDGVRLVWIPLEALLEEQGTTLASWLAPWRGAGDTDDRVRNAIAWALFGGEAASPDDLPPWSRDTVALALVAFDDAGAVTWVDRAAVARRGGRRTAPEPLLAGAGSHALQRARLEQFSDQLADIALDAAQPLSTHLRWIPPAGVLPLELFDLAARDCRAFPASWGVGAVPIAQDQLDAVLRQTLALGPFDLASTGGDELRLLVPVPAASWDPHVLRVAAVPPEFHAALTEAEDRRDGRLRRRAELRAKIATLYASVGGPDAIPPQVIDTTGDTDAELVENAVLWTNGKALKALNDGGGETPPLLESPLVVKKVAAQFIDAPDLAALFAEVLSFASPDGPMLVLPIAPDAAPARRLGPAAVLPGGWDLPHMAGADRLAVMDAPVVYLVHGVIDTEQIARAEDAAKGAPTLLIGTALTEAAAEELVWRSVRDPAWRVLACTLRGDTEAARALLRDDLTGLRLGGAPRDADYPAEHLYKGMFQQAVATQTQLALFLKIEGIDAPRLAAIAQAEADLLAAAGNGRVERAIRTRLDVLSAKGGVIDVPDRDALPHRARRVVSILRAIKRIGAADPHAELDLLVAAGALEAPFGTAPASVGLVVELIEELEATLNAKVTPPDNTRVVAEDELETLGRLGIAGILGLLEEKVKRADDAADFGFLQVQAALYRVRAHVLGRAEAERMAGSPLLGDIADTIQGDASPEQLAKFFDDLKEAAKDEGVKPPPTPAPWKFSTKYILPTAIFYDPTFMAFTPELDSAAKLASTIYAAPLVKAEPAPVVKLDSKYKLAARSSSASFMIASSFLSAQPAAPAAAPPAPPAPPPAATPPAAASPAAAKAWMIPTGAQSMKSGGPSAADLGTRSVTVARMVNASRLIRKIQPVGFSLRASRITDRAKQLKISRAEETRRSAFRLRASVTQTIVDLDLNLKGVKFPGFLKLAEGGGEPRFESRAFDDGRVLLQEVLDGKHDLDTTDADPAGMFSDAIRSLETTTAMLRIVESRVDEVREVIHACARARDRVARFIEQAEIREDSVEEQIAEARHDVSVTRALLAEEQERVDAINARRARILAEEVPFVVYARARIVDVHDAVPVHDVEPRISPKLALEMLSRPAPASPEELRDALELWHDAPARYLTVLSNLLPRLDRVEVIHQILLHAQHRARIEMPRRARGGPFVALAALLDARRGRLVVRRQDALVADARLLAGMSWKQAQARARAVLTVGDLLAGGGARANVAARVGMLLDHIHKIAANLYTELGLVAAHIRSQWVRILSAYDTTVDLRDLSVLPRWAEVGMGSAAERADPLRKRELQAMVDWLYDQVDPDEEEAMSLMGDLVRVCILLASHAPVGSILAGHVEEPTKVAAGQLFHVKIDTSGVRIGMAALVMSRGIVKARGVVEDIGEGRVVARFAGRVPTGLMLAADEAVHLVEPDGVAMAGGPDAEDGVVGKAQRLFR